MVSWDRSVLCHYSLPDTASDRFVSISLILSIELGWLGVNFEASKLHTVAWLWVCWTLRHDSDSVGEWQVLCHCLWVSDRCFLVVCVWVTGAFSEWLSVIHSCLWVSDRCFVIVCGWVTGAFSEWLSEHPDVIGHVLPLLLQGLRDPLLAQSASMSLKDLVRECQLHLQPYASSILVAAKVCQWCSSVLLLCSSLWRVNISECSIPSLRSLLMDQERMSLVAGNFLLESVL